MLQLLVLHPGMTKEAEMEGTPLLTLLRDPYILIAAGKEKVLIEIFLWTSLFFLPGKMATGMHGILKVFYEGKYEKTENNSVFK